MVVKGGNFGWSQCEGVNPFNSNNDASLCDGTRAYSPYRRPKLTYSHDVGNAVIGGYIYRANRNTCLQVRHCACHCRSLTDVSNLQCYSLCNCTM